MRLLTGPAGSGKTSFVLERFREALRAGDASVRLLAPTATMARHLQNRIAREGFLLRRELIQTLSGFLEAWAGGARQPSGATFYLIVEQAVERACCCEFARVARLPGFCASLARTISEFSSAGCDSARLAGRLPDAPLAAAFLAVYREVDRELERRGMALRGKRLELAAEKIEREGLGGVRTIWLDGFHALPDPELRVVEALDRRAELTLTLADADWNETLRSRLGNISAQTRFERKRPNPALTLFHAPSVEREASEIARRILEQAAAGRPFREMGIIVRAAEAYVPALRSTLGRFGIPARFYFDSDLERHPAVRFLANAMDATLAGWDHARTLAALRLAPRFADSNALDRFDFAVREQIPNAGLGGLKALLVGPEGLLLSSGAERLLHKIERMAAIEEWRSFALTPKDWADRLSALRGLFRAARPPETPPGHEVALEWRSQAAALDLFDESLVEAAEALDAARTMPLEEFWRAVKSVLRLKPLRLDDGRRNVVAVLSAPEAREWELPVVFICGMTEKQFPQIHRQDPFFPDEARRRLQESGVRVRTAAEFEREERALFQSAISRATMLATLSYPECDARGESALPSLFLEDLALVAESAAGIGVLASNSKKADLEVRPTEIHAPEHLRTLRQKTALVSPTALESYLQCPFQYFAGKTLRLKTAPPRPEDRLDFMKQGNIVHDTLAEWYAEQQDIAAVFERVFEAALEDLRISSGYHVERLRNAMLEDLRAFAGDERWPRAAFRSQTEQSFEFALETTGVRGKIDRLDVAPDGRAYVIDYKYSAPQRTKERRSDANLLQAPLYAMAAEKAFGARLAGMFYVGLKGGPLYVGWSDAPVGEIAADPIPPGWLESAEARTLRVVEEIRTGRVEAAPSNPANCRFCDYGDVCRVRLAAGAERGSGMSEIRFTPSQAEAIDPARRHLDACVVAGPGSGKTTVLVEYFGNLVEAGVDPLRILAITFTEKAAGNMRKKLAEAFRGDRELRARLERAWVSTVHGFCGRLLRENAVFAGIDPEFYVAGERESWRLQRESLPAAMDELFREHPAAVRALIHGLSSPDFEEAALSSYDAMRGAGVPVSGLAAFPEPPGLTARDLALTLEELIADPAEGWSRAQREHLASIIEGAGRIALAPSPLESLRAVEAFYSNLQKCKRGTGAYELVVRLRDEIKDLTYSLVTAHYAPQRELLIDLLRRFDRSYRERKRQAGALDFADLEEAAARLLEENPDTRASVQAQFDHILMDEYQDTNGQQARLLDLLRRPGNFYAVGDVNQSIFGFRHAEPEVFRKHRDAVESGGARLVELAGNFRSRADILRAVETVAAGAPGIERRPLTAERKFAAPEVVAVECMSATAGDMDAALRIEARWVAHRVLELGRKPGDIALLVRNTEVIPEFTAAFDEAGIPYAVNRGRGFYDCREVADLANLLRAIANPRDEIALAAVLRSPFVQVSPDALLQLRSMGDNLGAALMTLSAPEGFEGADYQALRRFRERLKEWRTRREYVTFDRLLLAALAECGYRVETGARGAANIDKFLAQAREAAAQMSLDEFVEELALLREENPREEDAPPEDAAAGVQIMTVHSAKGLEFPVVFVAALHKGVETSPPPVAFSPRIGLGVRWRNPARREEKDDVFQHALRQERQQRETEESNRLLYVAMTRAEERLFLSFSGNRKKPQNWAALVAANLGFDPAVESDETVVRSTPDGEPWKLRLVSLTAPPPLAEGDLARSVAPLQLVAAAPVEHPAVTGQQDANATVTALTEFARCPRAYYLGHYLGFDGNRPTSRAGRTSAAELGLQVHALLSGQAVADADPEAVRLAGVFRQSPLGRRAAQASGVGREYDFLMAVEDLVIRGTMDLWFEEGGEVVLVDYKTDDVTRSQAHERARDYALQLRLYALAVERIAGKPPSRAYLHFLRPNEVVDVDLAPSLLDSPEQTVRDFQEAQATLMFPMNPGERCHRCPFAHDLCPAVV